MEFAQIFPGSTRQNTEVHIITDTLLKKKASGATVSHTRIFIIKDFSYINCTLFLPNVREIFPNFFFRADYLHMQIDSTYGTYILYITFHLQCP